MFDIFSDDNRRNPYPLYEQMRSGPGVFHVPPPFDAWLIFDYEGVKRALADHESFSSAVPAPPNWFIFFDPPRHTKQRALISRAFTPRSHRQSRAAHPPVVARVARGGDRAGRIRPGRGLLRSAADESDRRDDRHPSGRLGAVQRLERRHLEAQLHPFRRGRSAHWPPKSSWR